MGGMNDESLNLLEAVFSISVIAIFLFKDGLGGYSPGKAICGVQVLDVDTREPIGFGVSLKKSDRQMLLGVVMFLFGITFLLRGRIAGG